MISEGSFDTEDWSNDEVMMLKIQLYITGINYILKYSKTENNYFNNILIK